MPWLENVIVRLFLTSQTLGEQFQKDWSNMMADWQVFTFDEASGEQYSCSINVPDDGREIDCKGEDVDDDGDWKISPRCPPLKVNTCN